MTHNRRGWTVDCEPINWSQIGDQILQLGVVEGERYLPGTIKRHTNHPGNWIRNRFLVLFSTSYPRVSGLVDGLGWRGTPIVLNFRVNGLQSVDRYPPL